MIFDARTESHLATLRPEAEAKAREFLARIQLRLAKQGVMAKVIAGTRTWAEQDRLYAKGRTVPGPRVTNARGGYSNHNFGIAWDIGLFLSGQYLAESALYRECGVIGREMGLEWGGDWKSFPDEPHYQLKTGLSVAELRRRVQAGTWQLKG